MKNPIAPPLENQKKNLIKTDDGRINLVIQFFLCYIIFQSKFMCFTKHRQKPKKSSKIKSKFSDLTTIREKLCQEHQYSRFFFEIMLFMEESIRQDIASPVAKMCSCINIPESYVRERFHEAYQECSIEEKLDYYQWAIKRDENLHIENVEKIEFEFPVLIMKFATWGSTQKAKLKGFRFATSQYQIDLRRYLVRESRSPIRNSFVLEAYYPTKPKKIRFSFDQSQTIQQDIDAFLYASQLGFKFTVENWRKKVDYLDCQSPHLFKKQTCETKGDDSDEKQKDVQSQLLQEIRQSQNGDYKYKKKPQIKQFRFTEQSSQEENQGVKEGNDQRKVWTQKNYSPFLNNQRNKDEKREKMMLSNKDQEKNTKQTLETQKKNQGQSQKHMSRNQRNIIKLLFPYYKLEEMENIEGYYSLSNLRQNQNSAFVYKHKKQKRIKGKVRFQGVSPKMMVIGVLNFFSYPRWNRKIARGDILMKLQSENSMMATLSFKEKNSTPFTFISHLCEYKNEYYVILKIYACQDEEMKKNLLQSYFQTAIIKILGSTHKNTSGSITLDILSENKGNFAIDFIKSFENLDTFLQHQEGIQSMKQHLKFGWKIDKQMENQFIEEFDRRSNEYSYASQQFGHVQSIGTEDPTFITIGQFSQIN